MANPPLIPITDFGGLKLAASPDEVGFDGAIDMLNIDLSRPGVLQSRPGTTIFFTPSGTITDSNMIAAHKRTGAADQLVIAYTESGVGNRLRAISNAGASIAVQTVAGGNIFKFARYGDPSNEFLFFANATVAYKWNGTAFAVAALPANVLHLAVQPGENRLVTAGGVTVANRSKVQFSDEGAPEVYTAGNDIDLTPGDGEEITALCTWRDSVFAFKETKFFVFYGNTSNDLGQPEFNYRPVEAGVGPPSTSGHPVAAAPDGVYFLARDGVYKTTGGMPEKISSDLDPFFIPEQTPWPMWQGGQVSFYSQAALAYFNDALYVSVFSDTASGGVPLTNQLTFVYYPKTEQWAVWNIGGGGAGFAAFDDSSTSDESPNLYFVDDLGQVRMIDRSATTDYGNNFTKRYRSGFSDFGMPGSEKRLMHSDVWGTGNVTLKASRDFEGLSQVANLTLGPSLSVVKPARAPNKVKPGNTYSFEISSTDSGRWTVHSIIHQGDPAFNRYPGHRTP